MLRVGVFVNVTNQFGALTHHWKKGYRVEYEKYLAHFTAGEQLILAVAYGTQVRDEADAFTHALKRMGYIVRFVHAEQFGRQEIIHPNRNVEIAVEIMGVHEKLDHVVIGSNDPELIPLIKMLQSRGIKVTIATPVLVHNEGMPNVDITTIPDLVVNIQSLREKKL
jgi:uncharacterized LabA/DUF88 family protein